jgi:DHA1 family multidrug resistance protein B-like MFS transporter
MRYRSLHPNLRIRIVVGAVQRFLNIMVLPLVTLFLAGRFGVTAAGLMMLTIALMEVAGTLAGGHLSDTYGRRPLLIAGETGVALATAVMALAASSWLDSPILIYVGFALASFSTAMALPANDAMIVDVTDSDVRKFVYTINYWAINLALACGVILGGFLYAGYFPYLLLAVALGSVAVLAVTVVKISETAPAIEAHEGAHEGVGAYLKGFVQGYRLVLGNALFAALLLAATLRMALEVQINYFINVRVSEGFPEQTLFTIGSWAARVTGVEILGILRAENTLLVVVLALVVLGALKRLNDRFRLYVGVVLFTLGTIVMAISNSGWILLAAMLVLTIGELLNVPVQQAMLADLVPEQSRTRYMAVFNLNVRLALLIASVGLAVGPWLKPAGMAIVYAAMGAVIILGYRIVLNGMRKTPEAAPAVPVPPQGTEIREAAEPAQ